MLDDGRKPRFDPRSPVQQPKSAAPYFVVAVIAAVLIWGLRQNWPPAPMTHRVTPSTAPAPGNGQGPRGDVRSVFTADDYPAVAQRNGEEGTAQARLTVGPTGRVTRCDIIRSSGSRALDDATCSVLDKRARFTPARDSSGNAVVSTVVTPPITWKLEG